MLRQKIERNYAGYPDKVHSKNKATYLALVKNLEKKATQTNSGRTCQPILEKYISFFKDRHLQLEDKYGTGQTDVEIEKLPASGLDAYYKTLRLAGSDIRGVWQSENYKLAIVSEAGKANEYLAIVISSKDENWKESMVKMRLKQVKNDYYEIDYRLSNAEKFTTNAFLDKNILDILSIGIYHKIIPAVSDSISVADYTSVFPDTDIKFTFPDDSTAVLFLGSFGNQYEYLVDSLMQRYKADLEKRPYWIVDISYNGGGGTGTYKSLLPYLCTNSINRSGSYYRLSEANVQNLETQLKNRPDLPVSVRSFFSMLIAAGKKNPDSWYFEKGQHFDCNTIQNNPKKIGVLISNKTASAGEIFVMDAKQSRKVTVFGTQTAGVVDYGDGTEFYIGCDSMKVSVPMRKSEYLKNTSYDNIGLKPDIFIADTERFSYKIIMDYFRNGRKPKQIKVK